MFRSVAFAALASLQISALGQASAQSGDDEEQVVLTSVRPDPAYFEKRDGLTRLNFDFELENRGETDVEINFIGMRAFDAGGDILLRRYMGGNGLPGPIAMLPDRTIRAGDTRYVFNPFPDLALAEDPGHVEMVVSHTSGVLYFDVPLRPVRGPALKRPPMDGVSYVYSGNDLFAHHRRVSLDSEAAAEYGMEHIAQRFALDFTRLNPQSGDLYTGGGADLSNWHGFGADVFAPIDGRVAAVRSDMPDNMMDENGQRIFAERFLDYGDDRGLGNYLTLELSDGSYLIVAHFIEGSLELRTGDVVAAGDHLGQIGLSGDTAYPHLHIQLQDGPDYIHSKPLPIEFECVARSGRGEGSGAVDTGDFLSPCGD